jgi:NADH:ubiquinone reductase (H+-translocating)
MKKVVIIGGGFAGLNAARALAGTPVGITIVDRRNFHLFQPLLYQVATAGLNPSDIAYPIRAIFRRQPNVERIVLAEVTGIDVDVRHVTVDDGEQIPYDWLLVATGATHSYFGKDDWASLAPGLKTIEDALAIRGRVLTAFERAERHPEDAARLLTFVVIGAGPTGVEMAGAMIEIAVHALAREFDRIDPRAARVVLVEGTDRVLPTYPPRLSASARHQLEELGVEVRTDALASDIDERGVTLSDGSHIESATVVWAAGVRASPLGAALQVETDRAGRVVVTGDLSIPEHPEVFVAGDLASLPGVPGVAPAAIQQGRHVARQIVSDIAGREREDFHYRDKGTLATIGRARAVADMGPARFGGFAAWVAWLAIHIFYLIGFRNRLFVFLSWAWNYLTFSRGARMITDIRPASPGGGDAPAGADSPRSD